jgi:hypothetical protein
MKKHALGVVIQRILDRLDEGIAKESAPSKMLTRSENYEFYLAFFVVLDSELVEPYDGIVRFTKIIIRDERGSGAEYGFGKLRRQA